MRAPSVPLEEIVAATTAYVDPHGLPDYAPTGLQVRGVPASEPAAVERVAVAVTASRHVIDAAAGWGADLLVTHHGLFWGAGGERYDPASDPARPHDLRRVAALRAHRMSLAAYHLPLDAHPRIGNNALLAERMGLTVRAFDLMPIAPEVNLGLTALAGAPLSAAELGARAEAAVEGPVLVVPGKPEGIRNVGIISGGGTQQLHAALGKRLDAYVTGEGREWAYHLAREAGITFVVLGHHASERYGVQALARWITRRWNLAVTFIDEPNPY